MHKIARRAFQVLAAFTLCATFVGCASTPAVPLKKDELDGAKYKLVVISGRLDQRVVQFRKRGGGYVGVLVHKGKFLQELVGVADDMEMFRIGPIEGSENSYEGVFITFQGDGSRTESEVKLTFYKDNFTWNLESATWERVTE
ncbi:MAG: hypothetical protein SF187_15320 [Deltaproteobacteria bacterium]|nr:hypothetical protein [Deltaproteobacteria bacterium]